MTDLNENQKNNALFVTLIQQFQMQGWVSLGKLKNPATEKIEKNLDLARLTIDMLEMLEAKTKGNLPSDESQLLTRTISDLKLNFVSEIKKDQKIDTSEKNDKS